MPITRRAFMKGGAMAVVGTSVVPAFLTRSVLAQATTAQAQGKRLVVLFQRGAADGLNVVVPYAEKNYYSMRPTIAIQKNQVIDLNGFFGLHPEMQPLKPLWDQGHLAIVHAAGSPDESRSHFDAQDYMESGTPGVKVDPGRLAESRPAGRRSSTMLCIMPPPFAPLPWVRSCPALCKGSFPPLPSAMCRISTWAAGIPPHSQ